MKQDEKEVGTRSCMHCGKKACESGDTTQYPSFCLTNKVTDEMKQETRDCYTTQGLDRELAMAAAEVEGEYYGRATRAEEIIYFAQKIGAKKIGIASCVGLLKEAQTFCRLLKNNDLEFFGVVCKAGAIDKEEIGIPEGMKLRPGEHESICNPILQAKLLNEQQTDLNVVIGLCVGHDSLFYKYSEAPVTTFIVKDRVLGHNPAAAVYLADSYYKKIYNTQRDF